MSKRSKRSKTPNDDNSSSSDSDTVDFRRIQNRKLHKPISQQAQQSMRASNARITTKSAREPTSADTSRRRNTRIDTSKPPTISKSPIHQYSSGGGGPNSDIYAAESDESDSDASKSPSLELDDGDDVFAPPSPDAMDVETSDRRSSTADSGWGRVDEEVSTTRFVSFTSHKRRLVEKNPKPRKRRRKNWEAPANANKSSSGGRKKREKKIRVCAMCDKAIGIDNLGKFCSEECKIVSRQHRAEQRKLQKEQDAEEESKKVVVKSEAEIARQRRQQHETRISTAKKFGALFKSEGAGEKLEKRVFTKCGSEVNKSYYDCARDFLYNLQNNKTLLNKVLSGKISLKKLSLMSGEELAGNDLREERRKCEVTSTEQRILQQKPVFGKIMIDAVFTSGDREELLLEKSNAAKEPENMLNSYDLAAHGMAYHSSTTNGSDDKSKLGTVTSTSNTANTASSSASATAAKKAAKKVRLKPSIVGEISDPNNIFGADPTSPIRVTEKFVLFSEGVFCQWYPIQMEIMGHIYNSCGQFILAEKARLFKDDEHLHKILASSKKEHCKKLGTKIHNIDNELWVQRRASIAFRSNLAKFTQNRELRQKMFYYANENRKFAYASANDMTWGIGVAMHHRTSNDDTKWDGINLLGKSITRVRNALLGQGTVPDDMKLPETPPPQAGPLSQGSSQDDASVGIDTPQYNRSSSAQSMPTLTTMNGSNSNAESESNVPQSAPGPKSGVIPVASGGAIVSSTTGAVSTSTVNVGLTPKSSIMTPTLTPISTKAPLIPMNLFTPTVTPKAPSLSRSKMAIAVDSSDDDDESNDFQPPPFSQPSFTDHNTNGTEVDTGLSLLINDPNPVPIVIDPDPNPPIQDHDVEMMMMTPNTSRGSLPPPMSSPAESNASSLLDGISGQSPILSTVHSVNGDIETLNAVVSGSLDDILKDAQMLHTNATVNKRTDNCWTGVLNTGRVENEWIQLTFRHIAGNKSVKFDRFPPKLTMNGRVKFANMMAVLPQFSKPSHSKQYALLNVSCVKSNPDGVYQSLINEFRSKHNGGVVDMKNTPHKFKLFLLPPNGDGIDRSVLSKLFGCEVSNTDLWGFVIMYSGSVITDASRSQRSGHSAHSKSHRKRHKRRRTDDRDKSGRVANNVIALD